MDTRPEPKLLDNCYWYIYNTYQSPGERPHVLSANVLFAPPLISPCFLVMSLGIWSPQLPSQWWCGGNTLLSGYLGNSDVGRPYWSGTTDCNNIILWLPSPFDCSHEAKRTSTVIVDVDLHFHHLSYRNAVSIKHHKKTNRSRCKKDIVYFSGTHWSCQLFALYVVCARTHTFN